MNQSYDEKVKALIEECKHELKRKDNRIAFLESECTRLFEPTRKFWSQNLEDTIKIATQALEEIEDLPPLQEYRRKEISREALSKIRERNERN